MLIKFNLTPKYLTCILSKVRLHERLKITSFALIKYTLTKISKLINQNNLLANNANTLQQFKINK